MFRVALIGLVVMGCGSSAQERYAQSLMPAQLALERAPVEKAALAVPPRRRRFRVRVYATEDYRIEVREWQRRFRTLVQRVNQLLGPAYGVALEVEEFRNWNRRSNDVTMEALRGDLEKLDAGEDVDWVVGLITAEAQVSASLHTLGMAELLGRHFVMRNLNDVEEYKALGRVLDELPSAERYALYADRKLHKELVIFLHEWGHTLGAMHIFEDKSLMNPIYDQKQTDFSQANARIMEISLRHREALGLDTPRNADWIASYRNELRDYLTNNDDRDWDRASRKEVLARVSVPASPPPPRGKVAAAPVAAVVSADAKEDLLLAESLLAKKETSGARAVLARAEARLSDDSPRLKPQIKMLAELYQRALLPSASERVAKRVSDKQVLAWAKAARRTYAIPDNAAALGLPAEREDEYVDLQLRAGELAWGGAPDAARAAIDALRAAFPSLPAPPLRQCELYMRLKKTAPARAACEQALAIQEDAVMAHFYLGQIAALQGKQAAALSHMMRALELDPTKEVVWRVLGMFYQKGHQRARLEQLREWYADRFGRAMN